MQINYTNACHVVTTKPVTYTMSLKSVIFDMVSVQIKTMNFDDVWQKCSKTKDFACFSRPVGLFVLLTVPNVIKIDPYKLELYRFKVDAFFETQSNSHWVYVKYTSTASYWQAD